MTRQDEVYSMLNEEEKSLVDSTLGLWRGGDRQGAILFFIGEREQRGLARPVDLTILSGYVGSYERFREGLLGFYEFKLSSGADIEDRFSRHN
jgi:hypothetical protein